jgi:O-antigen/teichoic acid export membrane protein
MSPPSTWPATSAPTPSRARQFARNSVFGTVAGFLIALGSVAANVIVAQCLGVESTGVVAFALWVAVVTAAIVDLGIQATLARYLPELIAAGREHEAQRLSGALLRPLAICCGVALSAFVIYAIWQHQSGRASAAQAAIWVLVGCICVLQALAGFTSGCLRGLQRFDTAARLTAVSFACQIAGVAIGSATIGVLGALGGYCAGSAVPAALSLRYAGSGGALSEELRARVRRYALFAWASALSSTVVWSRAELFFLQRSTGSTAVGLFTVGLTLANLAAQAPMLLTAGLLPYFAQSYGRQAMTETREAYATATRVLAFLVFPACFGMAAIAPTALPLIFGQDFAAAVPSATVLVLAAAIGATSSVGSNLLMAMDRSDVFFVSGLVLAILSIIAGFTVIPAYGLMGAAWSRAAIQTSGVAFGCWFLFRRLRFPLPFGGLFRLFLAACLCGIAARACLWLTTGVTSLALAVVVGIGVYAIAVRFVGALHPDDAERLRRLCRGFPESLQRICDRLLRLLAGMTRPVRAVPLRAASLRSLPDGD